MKVDYIIQNKVTEENFEDIIYEWLSKGDYTPDDIIENIITEHNLMFFPVHYYKSSYIGTATASLGYDRREYYYEWNESLKRQEKKSKIVTDWMPHSQNAFGDTETTIYAGDPKFNFLRSFIECTHWSGTDLMKIEANTGKDHKLLNLFKQDMTDAWNRLGLKECNDKAERQIINGFPSKQVRNFNANLQINVKSHTSLILPYWVFMYNYEDKPYYVAVDGNQPNRVTGVRPENKKRKNQVRAIRWVGWLSTIGLSYLGANNYYQAHSQESFKALGIALLIFIILGFVVEGIVTSIKNTSKKIRQEKLAKMREAKANS